MDTTTASYKLAEKLGRTAILFENALWLFEFKIESTTEVVAGEKDLLAKMRTYVTELDAEEIGAKEARDQAEKAVRNHPHSHTSPSRSAEILKDPVTDLDRDWKATVEARNKAVERVTDLKTFLFGEAGVVSRLNAIMTEQRARLREMGIDGI